MCGIVLVDGLKRLKYRWYDSAGLAVPAGGGVLELRRQMGKIVNLERAVLAERNVDQPRNLAKSVTVE